MDRPGPEQIGPALEAVAVPLFALVVAAVLFGGFVWVLGQDPLEVYALIYRGGFASAFSWQNSLSRAAPLILTALCVALPAQVGLMIIGGEGALVLGGLAAAVAGHLLDGAPVLGVQIAMLASGMAMGALWIMVAGGLRHYRGVNETISSLLLAYIAIALFNHLVEGPLRDPASLNKPSTFPIGELNRLGNLPGMNVHWGLGFGILACIAAYILVFRTTTGFAMRVSGGNLRAGLLAGLPTGRLVLLACALGGLAAGLAGAVEVAAVHGAANASLIAGYGYAGILVAFIARQNPIAICPVAILLGGISASGGMLQRRLNMPDAAVLVLEGIAFVLILACETLYGRINWQARARVPATPTPAPLAKEVTS